MLDEFPALGRLDFFESALAFMAGYGLKAFLIAQSLNQIERAYGQNNSILDNCHVRVSFATNDERTAKRVSDALGTATELRDSTNYAGHRLAPWLGHLMVSRQETARPLLTPGEIMQLPPTDEIVMVAGTPPIRATKARYFEDARFTERILAPPDPVSDPATNPSSDDWSSRAVAATGDAQATVGGMEGGPANAGIRREPELPEHEEIVPPPPSPEGEFDILDDEPDLDAANLVAMRTKDGVATLSDLVRSSLRLRPDRIPIGEVRASEALDLLKAWGTGHPGGIGTIHAGTEIGALRRLEQLIQEAVVTVPRALIAETIDLVAVLAGRGSARRLAELARVEGLGPDGDYRITTAIPTSTGKSS